MFSSSLIASMLVETLNEDERAPELIWESWLSAIHESTRFGASVNLRKKYSILRELAKIKLGPEYDKWPCVLAHAEAEMNKTVL